MYCKEQGKLDEAVACYRRALELKPDYAEAHNNLGNALKDQGKLDEAVACYRRALELKPDFAEAHNNLGNALKEQGKLDEAVACYRRALELKPDFAEAHGNLGERFGGDRRFSGAEDSFRAALRHDSRFAFGALQIGGTPGRQTSGAGSGCAAPLVAAGSCLRRASGVGGRSDDCCCTSAWPKSWTRGASMPRPPSTSSGATPCNSPSGASRGQEYDPKEYESLVTRMIAACTPDFFERVRGFGLESEIPVFIVGLPRSGTTLIEQILASHSQVFAAGEIKLAHDTMAALGGQGADSPRGPSPVGPRDGPPARFTALGETSRIESTALRIVDKMPDNYLYLGLLAGLFPRAKFIHCRRDLRNVAVSCWMTHFREVRWANDQQHIASRFHSTNG